MASFHPRLVLLLFISLFVFLVSPSFAAQKSSFRPRALVLPVTKDAATGQYVTSLKQRTPLVPVKLTVDVGGRFLWVNCDSGYVSSSYRTPRCRSAQCSLARADTCGDCFDGPRPGCNNRTCSLFPENTATQSSTIGEVTEDIVSVLSTDGSNPGRAVSVPRFLFTCGSTFLTQGLATGVTGVAGLGRTKIALPSQFASAFSFRRKFAVCLPSSGGGSSTGVVFLGNSPYKFLPGGVDVSASLTFTPLLINPVSTAGVSTAGERSDEYFIGVKSIKVNGKTIPVNSTLLKINKEGYGGTKISTVSRYTALETSIYNAVVAAFVKSLSVARVKSVAPFGACFSSKSIGSTRVGPAVPTIDLVLQNPKVSWRIFGGNSMVEAKKDVLCLGFVDGGSEPRTSIVIGGYQLEDNLLQFDLASSRLGFSSSLRFRQTTCANFNFTSNA
ncbi:hypothetical protein H6P81_002485 [Aristolochia fimbriata]|uniref:Peptidase A1 domain-containing protein n=1 Tax=Aristolochia fimbriata TaxID=158543 RepID=A0AAV7FD39_ARIFI|nr:hypothetical protein H6P81_002485 [Aristolochia fimbriata]